MGFIQGKRNDINFKPAVIKTAESFISYSKKLDYGEMREGETNKLVFRIKNDKIKGLFVTIFIRNPFQLQLAAISNDEKIIKFNKVIVLQSKDGNIYLVPTSEGRAITVTKTWADAEIGTYARYLVSPKQYFDLKEDNEHLFTISSELSTFIAYGEGIDGETFKGYKLEYVKSFKDSNKSKDDNINEKNDYMENNNDDNNDNNEIDIDIENRI